jgi:hypothetical protein
LDTNLLVAGWIALGAAPGPPPPAPKSLGSPLILFTVLFAAAILLIAVLALLRMLRESLQRDIRLETPVTHKPIKPSPWSVAGARAKPIPTDEGPEAAPGGESSSGTPRPKGGA